MTRKVGGMNLKKKFLTAVLVSAITLSSLALPVLVAADDLDNVINQQTQEIIESQKNIDNLNAQQAAAEDKIAKLEAEIADIQADAQELQAQQDKLNTEIAELDVQISDLTSRIAKRNEALEEQARNVQVSGQETSVLNAILEAESFSDAISRIQSVNTMVQANNDMMKQQEKDKEDVVSKQDATKAKSEEVMQAQVELEQKLVPLSASQLELDVLKADLELQKATEQGNIEQAQTKKAEAEAEKERQEAAAAAAEAARVAAEAEAARQAAADAAAAAANNTPAPSNNGGSSSNGGSSNGGSNAVEVPNTVTPPVSNAGGIVGTAQQFLGVQYVWGGTTPSGFDCSGLVQYVYNLNGISLPRVTTQQEYAGTMIPISQAQAGDLYFWGARGSTHHVAIATGGGGYIHAPKPGDVVKTSNVSWYTPDFAVRL